MSGVLTFRLYILKTTYKYMCIFRRNGTGSHTPSMEHPLTMSLYILSGLKTNKKRPHGRFVFGIFFYDIFSILRTRRSILSNGLSRNVCAQINAISISMSSDANAKTFVSSWKRSSRACSGRSQRDARICL